MTRGKASPRYSPKRRSSRSGGGDGDANRWLGTYGDMITLLMAFFVMLYAISQVDQLKFQAFVEGLQQPFGNEAAVGMLEGGATLTDGAGSPAVAGPEPGGLMIMPPPTSGQDDERDSSGDDADEAEQDDRLQESASHDPAATDPAAVTLPTIAEQLRQALEDEGLAVDIAEVRPDERGVIISVASDDVLFALGSAQISPLGKRIVKAVARVVDDLSNEVIVEGHTDDLPLRRAGYDNWNLSTDRAVAVLQLLVDNEVHPRRLIASGYGEHRPHVENNSNTNRALNRRVDIVLVVPEGGSHG